MNEWTSEKLAKAIKGTGLCSDERVQLATRLWDDTHLFFPNKPDFLFDWLTMALAKPNLKKIDDCALYQHAYWHLLVRLLGHFEQQKAQVPSIRLPLAVAVGTLLHNLYALPELSGARAELLRDVTQCMRALLATSCRHVFRPSLDQITAIVDPLLAAIKQQINLNDQTDALDTLIQLAEIILPQYAYLTTQSASRKKMYTTFVIKFWPVIARIHRQLVALQPTSAVVPLLVSTTAQILFHRDSIFEYNSLLLESDAIDQKTTSSYVSRLFAECASLLDGDMEAKFDAASMLPILLSEFVRASRVLRHGHTDAPAQDVERRVEFGFYVHSVKLLDKMQAADVNTYLATHAQLLQELLHWGIYAATRNDEIKQQQHACLELLVNALTQQLDAPDHQAHVLTALNSFMQMDMTLVEPQMPSIWPVLLNPAPNTNAHDAAFALAATVLELYAAARQMDAFIDELLSTLDHIKMEDGHQMLQKPLFSKRFLQLFATVATKHVPGPQMAMLFDRLAAALTKAHDAGQHTTTMLLVSVYTVHFVAALRLGFHQRQWFERSSVALFERLLQPSMTHVSDVATHALPALQVHFALANAFYDVYWLKLDTAARNALAATWTRLFQQATHENTPTSRLFLIHCANALFQHLYYSAFELGHGRALDGNMALVAPVLDFVLQDGWQQAQWDGQLESITTMEHTKLALWKLMLDEWFDTICGVIQDDQRANKFIANILLTAGDNDNSMANGTMVSCRQLNLTLLRSANFYEAKCFHDHSVSVLLYGMVDLFKTPSSAEHGNLITNSIAKLDLSQPFAIAKDTIAPLADFLVASLSTPTTDAGMPAPAIATLAAKLAHYVDVLLIFPVEYYRKAQRAHLLWILFLVDAWLLTFANATPATLRCSLSCRTFYLRFMNTIGSIGVLNANPTLLQWFVSSVDQWRNSASLAAVSQDVDAWVNVTAEIDAKVLAAILSVAGGKNIDASTATYLQQTVAQRLVSFETPATLTWTLNLLKSVNQFLPAILKKVQDDASIFGTYTGVQTLAAYLCDQIAHAETRLGANDTWSQADISHFALCLRGVTLVQEYARCLKTQNKDLDVQRLSEVSQSLMVPFVAWLPAQLAQNEHTAALEATGAFMSASTSTLVSQRQEASTLQLFELYWTVYTLVYTPNGQEMIMTTLARHVTDWIRALLHDQLLVLLNAFVQKTQHADETATTPDQCRQHDVLITMLTLLITSTSDGQKQALRPFLSTCITKLAAIVGNATRVHLVDNILDVLHHISGDKAFEFQSFDVSTILSCLLQVLFPATMDELMRELTFARANGQFKKVAVILANLARLHRDPLSDTVGAFVAMLDTMLQCFKSAPLSLVSSNNSNNSNIRSLAGNPVAKKKKRKTMAMTQGEQRANVYQSFAPLDVSCAERYARVISELTSKVTGDKRSDLVFHHVSKHAPFLLLQYFAIQADPVMNITIPAIKTALSFAYHDLLNLCNADDRMFVLVALNATGQEIFKAFYTSWKEQYKYAGQ